MIGSGDVAVLIGQIGAGKSTVAASVAGRVAGCHLEIGYLKRHGTRDAKAIGEAVAAAADTVPVVFECTGASRDFEDVVVEIRRHGLRPYVVFLECSMETATRRVSSRDSAAFPTGGGTWRRHLQWTERRLRFVPSDCVLSTELKTPRSVAERLVRLWSMESERGERRGGVEGLGGTVSFSRLATLQICPLAYQLKYVQRVSSASGITELYLGELIHDTLAWIHSRQGPLPTLEEILLWFRRRIDTTMNCGGLGSNRRLVETRRTDATGVLGCRNGADGCDDPRC